MNNNWLKSYIVDIIPGITVLLYVLAIVYNISLYSVFNINITSFLSLSEILISIIEPLVILFVYALMWSWFLIFVANSVIPQAEEMRKKYTNNHKSNRLFKKLKNNKFFKSVFLEDQKKNKSFFKQLYSTLINNGIIRSTLIYLTCIAIVATSYYHFKHQSIDAVYGNGGMGKALYGIITPPNIIFIIIIFLFFCAPIEKLKNLFSKISLLDKIMVIAIYYVFAVFVFSHSGKKHGEQLLNANYIQFTINTSDERIFDDSAYLYLSQHNGFTFLYEKATHRNILLNNSGIKSLSIDFDDFNKSVFQSFFHGEHRFDAGYKYYEKYLDLINN